MAGKSKPTGSPIWAVTSLTPSLWTSTSTHVLLKLAMHLVNCNIVCWVTQRRIANEDCHLPSSGVVHIAVRV